MAAIITDIIPQQNFELVDERIGEILTVELQNQKTLQGFEDPANVFLERLDPFQHSEIVMVNVMYDGMNNSVDTQKRSQAPHKYFIDVYASGKATGTLHGGKASASRLHKFIGMCRHILSIPGYRTLGFNPGFIGGTEIESIQIANTEKEDAAYVTMGRITLSVRLSEQQPLETGELMKESLTGVKLEETEKGYKYQITT